VSAVTKNEMNLIRRLTKEQVAEVGSLLLEANQAHLEMLLDDPKTPVLKAMLAKVALKVIRTGDAMALSVLLDRMIGKVKETIEHTGANGGPISIATAIMHMTPEQREAEIQRYQKIRETLKEYDL